MFALALAFADYAALIAVFGTLTFAVGVLPDDAAAYAAAKRVAAQRALLLALGAYTFATIGVLFARIADATGMAPATAWPQIPVLLLETSYGPAWFMRCAGVAILCAAAAMRPPRLVLLSMSIAGASLIALSVAASGHAAAEGWSSVAVWIAFIHVAAGAIWAGTLLAGASLLRVPPSDSAGPLEYHARATSRLLRLASSAFLIAAVSGVASAWFRVPFSLDTLSTGWGLAFVLKIAVVIAILVVAVVMRGLLAPADETEITTELRHDQSDSGDAPAQTTRFLNRALAAQLVLVLVLAAAIAGLGRQEVPVEGEGWSLIQRRCATIPPTARNGLILKAE